MGEEPIWSRARLRAWGLRAVALSVVFVLVAALDPQSPVGMAVSLVTELAAVVVFLVAACRMPVARPVWWLLWTSQALVLLADLVYDVQTVDGSAAQFPGWSDAFYLAAYAPQAVAILWLVRVRGSGHSVTQRLDTAIVAVPVAAVTLVYVLVPLAQETHVTLGTWLALLYPVLDLLLLLGMVRLSVANGGHRNRSLGLLTTSVVTTLIADLAYTGLEVGGLIDDMPGWVSAMYTTGVVLMAAAALSADSRRILLVDTSRPLMGWTVGRIAALGGASLSLPVLVVIHADGSDPADVLVFALGAVVVNLLVIWRGIIVLRIINRQAAKLAVLARTDPLTGLPNRRSWDFELERTATWARETGEPFVLALLDLDRFKEFNDTRGHQAGDALLVACARAWRDGLPGRAYLARYGGDEFALLLPGTDRDRAAAILEDLRAVTPTQTSVSIGYVDGSSATTTSHLFVDADAALYRAKQHGRDRAVGPNLDPVNGSRGL